ncbi:MAG: type II secretion system protein GspK [Polyangiales bacterium]
MTRRRRAPFPTLAGSGDSRSRGRRRRARGEPVRASRQQGIALLIAIVTITILAVMVSELHETTGTGYAVAIAERDALRSEYLARSALDLTRLLVSQELQIRNAVNPIYQALVGRPSPQLPVWKLANDILQPFCDYESVVEAGGSELDFQSADGLGGLPGHCEIVSFAENSKVNVNDPLSFADTQARRSIAMQLFSLMRGNVSPSPYDELFSSDDADGLFTTRLDVITSVLDWWDADQQRTTFDPGAGTVGFGGGEDDVYGRFRDPYQIKNAPFDSIEELRLVRGVSDDFWATFVEPDPEDPESRLVTVYGSGAVNPNEAPADVLLARLCSFLQGEQLCINPTEQAKFVQLVTTARAMIPVPFFSSAGDFLTFVQGQGGPSDLYPLLRSNPLAASMLFTPVTIPNERRAEMEQAFVTAAKILTIQTTGVVGRTRTRIRAVVNFDERWTPPPPNAGRLPPLGVYHHYRID